MEGGAVKHNFERDPYRKHPCQVWFNLAQRFQRRRFKCDLLSQAKNRKKGDDIFKKSSLMKLLSQSQPNFAEMILGWSPSKNVSNISDL
jgi:hypothetical protein